ncbi:unnamed protein product [Cuscuta campestris]|uniref:Uncharacterized protein n=1 Tax=Cuscuta campestris TaxID=132261 RepID=A0A484ME62_9ASTE|nr:unnamed protein product [Cuscuta campestris]
MNAPPLSKRRRLEAQPVDGELDTGASDEQQAMDIEEEALIALIEHRSKEVEYLHKRVAYYKNELEEEEKRLRESQQKLVLLRSKNRARKSQTQTEEPRLDPDLNISNPFIKITKPDITFRKRETSSPNQPQSKPPSVILDVKQEDDEPNKVAVESVSKGLTSSNCSAGESFVDNLKGDKTKQKQNEKGVDDAQDRGATIIPDKKEKKDLIPTISCYSSPSTINCQTSAVISCQHKRKMRSLVLSPCNEKLFATSALDGAINLWQLEDRGSSAVLLSTDIGLSPKQRRWAEDVAWHPDGKSIISVYTADGGDSQISILNLNEQKENSRVRFLEENPHVKGVINCITFMPWEDNSFATCGDDHAVIFWLEKERVNSWKPNVLHSRIHSSSVMGVAGMQQKKIVISVGTDKRIVGFDVQAETVEYKHQLESKCMSVLPNPCDLNLFMVQSGTLEKQLRLFDIRAGKKEVHWLGWKQEKSESQSALIKQSWSPNGLYISSGSVDPAIHIFDIRYNSHQPLQSLNAHKNRVFKAAWHHTLPLLISISSDLNIGLHKTD